MTSLGFYPRGEVFATFCFSYNEEEGEGGVWARYNAEAELGIDVCTAFQVGIDTYTAFLVGIDACKLLSR